ncbi:substrate-binding domain-containing protein [Candidatus Reidiella endopervernicosa]|uniref:Substrate-binding domain-containing protein n=1 Tax=Candidatus Reidiella endopervernicosa TaxID=2738883 RepID=A0A6N0HWK9_9GAMM|nr:substrate-binding domain-containing protein [Candidatus Reidiella endopervernicosa]QKQ26742.1 substrate-binding domain-containing protein [Candidatus Reidiella endopervernicosa]
MFPTRPWQSRGGSLSGPAFSTPDHTEHMEDGWHSKAIKYEKVPEGTDISITLDQHLYPALLPIINDYGKAQGIKIAVKEGTCGISAGSLLDKRVDIAGFCCPPGETDRLPGVKFHTLGISAVAFFTHPDNPVKGLTIKQARDIYRGNIGQWNRITPLAQGLAGNQVEPVARLHCKARPGHWRLLLDNEDMFSVSLFEVSAIEDMLTTVASNPKAIGYESVWMTKRYAKVAPVKLIAINGAMPTERAALISGRYPIYRTYNITSWSGEAVHNERADALIEHIQRNIGAVDPDFVIIPAAVLRRAGWRFDGDELVGEPR